MPTETNLSSLALPAPVATYFATYAEHPDAAAACFSADGVVLDEARAHRGRAAIAAWLRDVAARYRYRSEPLTADARGAHLTVVSRVTGEFPGSPLMLRFGFTLADEAITKLEIAP